MKNYYIEKFTPDDTCIDFSYNMPIHEILKLIERATFNHANIMGLDHKTMEKSSNAFWIVTKLKLKIKSPISSGQKLNIKTWTHEPNLVRFKRDFVIRSNSRLLLKGSSEWCCLDMTTRKLRKASTVAYPELEMVEQTDVKTVYANLRPELDKLDYVYSYIVRATDIDVNFHTNNLKYNYMALNAFTVRELQQIQIKEYELYFINESHEGDIIEIYKKKIGNEYYYIEGKSGFKTIFKTIIKYKKIKT